MDTTPEYVKMADCEEIQKLWEPKDGDFHCTSFGDKYFNVKVEDIIIKTMDMVWLPRQGQLQEMLSTKRNIKLLDGLLQDFYFWEHTDDNNCFASFEQLWFAFVMKEKHSALWTGSEWDRAHWTKEELEK